MSRRFLSALRGVGPSNLETKGFSSYSMASRSLSRSSTSMYGADRAAGWDMDSVIAEGYERSVWAYRCVELYSGSQSRLPFRIGKNIGEEGAEVLDDHPLYRVLNRRANPHETGKQFRKRLSAQVLLSKRGSFIEVTRSRAGTISRLDLLDPSRVIPMPSDNGDYLDYFEFTTLTGEVREIAPERIRWVREPHPTDPFCGTTPLEAAGLSIELDQLSRLYNVSFIKNDSRPGGVLAVDTDTLRDAEMKRLENRFKPGAHTAGELAVVASGPGGVKYVDTTTRPRDMSYGEAAKNAKDEILSAFGVGESLLGNASGRSFDNAEQEEYNFWTKPMPPHLELIAGAFADDVDEEWEPFIDTSKVEALEIGQRKRRAEAREEVNAGLRSIDEYRPLSKLDPLANPQSRALWISPAKAPVPLHPEDAAVLLGGEGGGPAPTGTDAAGGGDTAPADAVTAEDVVNAAAPEDALDQTAETGAAAAALSDARSENDVVPPAGEAANAVAHARDADGATEAARAVTALSSVLDARVERKSLDPQMAVESTGVTYIPSEQLTAQAEAALVAALQAILARQRGVVTARLAAPRARKGTRFWRADGENDTRAGDTLIDVARVIDSERWAGEATQTASPLVQWSAIEAGTALLAAFTAAGALAALDEANAEQVVGAATRHVSLRVLAALAEAVTGFLENLRVQLDAEQRAADSITDLIGSVDTFYNAHADRWAKGVGGDLAHTAVVSATEAMALSLTSSSDVTGIVREWVSRRDDRVRPTHVLADGTVLPVGEPFQVGAELMLYPQDPTASPQERYGCRCRCEYRTSKGSTFTTGGVA